jgi:Na+-driven multidrug efflux pump
MFMEMTESIGFALFNHVASGFGTVVLAAAGIAGRVADLAFMPILGTAHGLLPIVGYSLGAKSWKRLWGSVKLASIWLAILMLAATFILEDFTTPIISLFNSDPALLEVAVPGMRIFCSTLVFIGPTIIFITTFQGLSKAKDAMVLSLGRQFIFFIPGLFILSSWLGINGVWISMPISDFLGAVTASYWIYREYRMQIKSRSRIEAAAEGKAISPSD